MFLSKQTKMRRSNIENSLRISAALLIKASKIPGYWDYIPKSWLRLGMDDGRIIEDGDDVFA